MNSQIDQIIKELEAEPQEKFWNVGPEVGSYLSDLAISLNAKKILEIGTSKGYSGLWFAKALQQTAGHLWTIESHKERYRLATETFAKANVSNLITQILGHAPEVFVDLLELKPVDLAFLDATKAEYASHLKAILPLLSAKGVIVADNIRTHFNRVQEFIELAESLTEYTLDYKENLGAGIMVLIPKSI